MPITFVSFLLLSAQAPNFGWWLADAEYSKFNIWKHSHTPVLMFRYSKGDLTQIFEGKWSRFEKRVEMRKIE